MNSSPLPPFITACQMVVNRTAKSRWKSYKKYLTTKQRHNMKQRNDKVAVWEGGGEMSKKMALILANNREKEGYSLYIVEYYWAWTACQLISVHWKHCSSQQTWVSWQLAVGSKNLIKFAPNFDLFGWKFLNLLAYTHSFSPSCSIEFMNQKT